MGLDFTPGSARWSYGGFHRFRQRLAAEAGYVLEDLFARAKRPVEYVVEYDEDDRHPVESFLDADPTDPLFLLLNHSDCDGIIPPEYCVAVALRVAGLVAAWPEDDYDHQQAERLIAGLVLAAATLENLRFH